MSNVLVRHKIWIEYRTDGCSNSVFKYLLVPRKVDVMHYRERAFRNLNSSKEYYWLKRQKIARYAWRYCDIAVDDSLSDSMKSLDQKLKTYQGRKIIGHIFYRLLRRKLQEIINVHVLRFCVVDQAFQLLIIFIFPRRF